MSSASSTGATDPTPGTEKAGATPPSEVPVIEAQEPANPKEWSGTKSQFVFVDVVRCLQLTFRRMADDNILFCSAFHLHPRIIGYIAGCIQSHTEVQCERGDGDAQYQPVRTKSILTCLYTQLTFVDAHRYVLGMAFGTIFAPMSEVDKKNQILVLRKINDPCGSSGLWSYESDPYHLDLFPMLHHRRGCS